MHYIAFADTYSHLGNRGFNPQAQQPYPARQPYDDPTYSRLEQFQRGGAPPQAMNGPHVAHQQGQQVGMGAGGMERQRMMAPQPPQATPPQYPLAGDDPYILYHHQQQQLPRQQQPVNAHNFLGVPHQLAVEPVQPAPAKPKEPEGWVCPKCTLLNNPRRPGCEVCSADRPADYVVPDEAPIAEFEKKARENEALFEEVRMYRMMLTS